MTKLMMREIMDFGIHSLLGSASSFEISSGCSSEDEERCDLNSLNLIAVNCDCRPAANSQSVTSQGTCLQNELWNVDVAGDDGQMTSLETPNPSRDVVVLNTIRRLSKRTPTGYGGGTIKVFLPTFTQIRDDETVLPMLPDN